MVRWRARGRVRGRVVQIPMRVFLQCLLLALYLFPHVSPRFSISDQSWLCQCRAGCMWVCEGNWRCVPDGVTSPQSDPLWDRSVLLLGSRELHLRAEGLVGLYCISSASICKSIPKSSKFVIAPPTQHDVSIPAMYHPQAEDCQKVERGELMSNIPAS